MHKAHCLIQGQALEFGRAVAEDAFVGGGDVDQYEVPVHDDDGVGGILRDEPESLFALPQGIVRGSSLGDVHGSSHVSGNTIWPHVGGIALRLNPPDRAVRPNDPVLHLESTGLQIGTEPFGHRLLVFGVNRVQKRRWVLIQTLAGAPPDPLVGRVDVEHSTAVGAP